MHVVATAGHVDHGKSLLVKALTGTDPDRHAEEKRRGLTIDLGYAWTSLSELAATPGTDPMVAFVDVPGHERFIATMLAGLGPAPAVMFVVAADEGWRQQSSEHLAAVDALRLRSGLLVITRSDLADPQPAMDQAREQLARSSLGEVPAVAVSAVTGQGLDQLRTALAELVRSLPDPRPDEPVRLWVDRSFVVRGAGTVITGTLGAGTLYTGQQVMLNDRAVRIRGLQSLNEPAEAVAAVARVAVNLRGVEVAEVGRGDVLLTPGDWRPTSTLDVAWDTGEVDRLPSEVQVHLGTAAVSSRVRPLGPDLARLSLREPLPVRFGDRLVLRDPGRHLVLGGAEVLDPDPPELRRRGSARRRGDELAAVRLQGTAETIGAQIRGRGAIRRAELRVRGFDPDLAPAGPVSFGDWLIDATRWDGWRVELQTAVAAAATARPLEGGLSAEVAARLIGLPDPELITGLADAAGLMITDGRISDPKTASGLGSAEAGLTALDGWLRDHPYLSPEHDQLVGWGLGVRELAAAERLGRVVRLTPEIVLAPTGPASAMRELAALPQPFTASEARQQLGTTRRVIIPLLEHLDRRGWTVRDDDRLRRVRGR